MQTQQQIVVAQEAADDDLEIDIATLWDAVVSRYKLCIAVGCVIVGIALAYCLLATPTYQATARLLAISSINQTTEFKPAVDTPQIDNRSFIATQIKALSARNLLEQLFTKFHLKESPAFAKARDPLAVLEKKLIIQQVPNTTYIDVGVQDADPQLAADMANALCEFFIADKQLRATHVSKVAVEHLQKELKFAEAERNKAIAAVNAFQTQHKWIELKETSQSTSLLLTELQKELSKISSNEQASKQIEAIRQRQKEAAAILDTYGQLAEDHQLLQDKLELAKKMHQILMDRVTQLEIAINTNSGISGVFSIDAKAVPPVQREKPKRMMIMAASVFAAAILGMMLCIVLELCDKSLKSKAELLRITRQPLLGTLNGSHQNLSGIAARLCSLNQERTFALAPIGQFEKHVTVSIELAKAFAQMGYTTLLIDANTEDSSLSDSIAGDNVNSIRIPHQKEMALPKHLCDVSESDAKFLSLGAALKNGFNRESLTTLLKQCETQFDVVLIHVADISTTASARVFCLNPAIQTILLVETLSTNKNELTDVMQTDVPFGLRPVGSILFERKRPTTLAFR